MVDGELLTLLAAGKLEQTCPKCGTREAAGYYCTACAIPTGPDDWRRGEATARQRAALEAARAQRHPEAHARAGNGSPLAKSGQP